MLNTVYRNVHRMLHLINQLLDFEKIENGALMLNVQEADIIRVLQGIYESFLYLAERKGVKLLFNPHVPGETLWVDTDKVEKTVYRCV